MTSRSIGLSLLLGVVACNPGYIRPETRATLVPQNGPRARVYATQFGGLTQRTVRTSFRADKNAHVVVGRLGGEGRIEILFPENPRASTLVAGGKTYNVPTFAARYDGVPQLFSYTAEIYRTHSARMDSYDGLGHGFVFVIASEFPINSDAIDDHGVWSDSLGVDDYYSLSDPRIAIRDFADVLTGGTPYSLDYAGVLNTYAFRSMADAAWDCAAMVSVFGNVGMEHALRMMSFGSGFGSASLMGFAYSPYAGCGFAYDRRLAFGGRYPYGQYFNMNTFGWGYGFGYSPWTPKTTTTTPPPPSKVTFASGERRPGRLTADEEGAGINLARPRFSGSKPTVTSASATPVETRPRYTAPRAKPTVHQDWAPPIREVRTTSGRANRPVLHDNGSSRSSGSSSNSGSSGSGSSSSSGTRSSGGSSSGSRSAAPAASRPSGSQGAGRVAPRNP